MKMITKNSDYAIRAVLYLAGQKERFVSSREISKKQKIPLLYLRRILQELIKKKLIISKEGASGGVKLKVDPANISIAYIISIIQGKIQLLQCVFRKQLCKNRSYCTLRKRVVGIEGRVAEEFERFTIQDLLDDAKEK